jgi:hypothetical protein
MQLIVKIQRLLGKRQRSGTRTTQIGRMNTDVLFGSIGSAGIAFFKFYLKPNGSFTLFPI